MDFASIIDQGLGNILGIDTLVFVLAAIGLNMHFGYTGLLNFGQAAFVAMGAYGVGISVTYLDAPLWVGFLVGIGAATVLALLLGIPTLRLRADYLAIATIATAEIFRFVARSSTADEITGGSNGINGMAREFYALNPFPPDTYGFGPWTYSERGLWIRLFALFLIALSLVVVTLLVRSPWGRVLKGIREDEDAVRSLGKNIFAYKMQALVLGGVIGAFAGFVLSLSRGSVQPDNYATQLTFLAYTALLLGGAARIWGPVLGAVILWVTLSLTDTILRGAVSAEIIPTWLMDGVQVGQVRFILVGLALMLLMAFRPQGILGDRRELVLDAR
ncbi:branched-chain amino acid ABC transporter permease [Aquipuribacter nitratireducens]|uniref:Branched-chain amino acid ABC transporter permease n=1 Tax=Aquipuribacter nitratireducens TaxID=650104 RepID=A0ABW0GKD0_9MICO